MWALLAMSIYAQSSLEQAVTLARERRYAEARKALENVAEPADAAQRIAYHRLKAAIASGLGEASAAAGEMRAALALSPEDVGLLQGAAMAELQAGELDTALQYAQKAGKTATAQALIGDIQEKRGHFVEAASAYQSAVSLAPDREPYRIALGLELIQHQKFRSAIDLLERSAPLFPRSAGIRTLLGIAQYADGDVSEGIASLQDAIAADPKMEAPYRCLARILLQSSAAPPPRAVTALCRWNAVVCSALRLRVARDAGDAATERAAIATLKRAPPGDAIADCELGRAYQWTGELSSARTQMEACTRLDPSPQNHYRLAVIYRKLGLADLARKELAVRAEILQKMSEETALGLDALQSFQYSVK